MPFLFPEGFLMAWQACRQTNLQLNKEDERQAGVVKCMTFVCYHMFALVLSFEEYYIYLRNSALTDTCCIE